MTWPSCRIVAGCTIREGQQGSSQLIAGTDNGYLHFWDCAGCCTDSAGCGCFDLCWPSAFRSVHSHPSSMFHRIGEVATSFRAWRQSRDFLQISNPQENVTCFRVICPSPQGPLASFGPSHHNLILFWTDCVRCYAQQKSPCILIGLLGVHGGVVNCS